MHAHRCAAASGRHCRRFAPVPEQPRPSPPPSRLARHHALLAVSLRTPAPAESRRLHFLPALWRGLLAAAALQESLASGPSAALRPSRVQPGPVASATGRHRARDRPAAEIRREPKMATIGIVTKTAQGFRGKLQTLLMK